MDTKRVDYLNIGLLVISFVLAIKLPFELFLFSYAILGPLHYLTEISWLHERNYFSRRRSDVWVLGVLCLFVTLGVLFKESRHFEGFGSMVASWEASSFGGVLKWFSNWTTHFIFVALVAALAFALIKDWKYRYGTILIAIVLAIFFNDLRSASWFNSYNLIIGAFVPTIIHVCLFTGLFMLYGALKSKSTPGMISVVLFVLIILSFSTMDLKTSDYLLNQKPNVRDAFLKSNFQYLNYQIVTFFGWLKNKRFMVDSPLGLRVQAFIAFAYTYHYLNWFSKTNIIKWNKVPRPYLIASVIVWVGSIALFLYDYRIGLLALFFLSMLHVFLELPLNSLSVVGIFNELKGRRRASVQKE